jgi:chromosome segregation ATPase
MRTLVRTLAWVVGLFALGLLAGYILLYQPAARQLARTQADLAAERSRAGDLESAAADSQAKLDELQRSYAAAQSGLDAATARMHLARMAGTILQARLALVDRDGPAAQKALKAAQVEFEALRPGAEKADSAAVEAIKLRLDLAVSELTRDPKTAQADLQILSEALATLDTLMAK